MSQSQAKAKRRIMCSGYANLGNSMRRPTVAGLRHISVADSIANSRRAALNEQKRKATKK